jgi:hypothetical protein
MRKNRDLILKKMKEGKCTKSDLIVNVRSKYNPRFKAGAELSGKVNKIEVDYNEEVTEDSELVEVKLVLTSKACTAEEVCED